MLPIYYFGIFICGIIATYANQKYARNSGSSANYFVYAFITGSTAMCVFYILSGFSLQLNLRTVLYSAAYALTIFINYFFTLSVFKVMGIAESTFICSGIGLMLTVLTGVFIFGEKLKVTSIIQVLLVLLMFFAIFLSNRKKQVAVKRITFIGVFYCVCRSVLQTVSSAINNAFASDTLVTDKNSFFFTTNLFITIAALLCVLTGNKFSFKKIKHSFTAIPKIGYFMIIITVIASNISSLINILILKESDLILFAPLSGALSLMGGETVAVLFAKEKPQTVAMLLAVASLFAAYIPL